MPKQKRPVSLSAAECARRTGLTVRALRVYERHGLIEPARSGKGWRCYGPKELQRLNVIVTLNFGPDDPIHRERIGDVVRVEELDEDKWGIAIRILMHNNPGIYSGT